MYILLELRVFTFKYREFRPGICIFVFVSVFLYILYTLYSF